LFENLTQPDVHEPEAVVAAKLDEDSVDHGMVAKAETDKDAQVAESPTPNPEASDIKKETPDTAEEVKDVAAPDVEVAKDVPEAAADQLAQDTTSEKVVADTAPEAVAPNTAPDQIEQVAQEGEPVSVAATDKVALKDD
jgi:hypothetical protein